MKSKRQTFRQVRCGGDGYFNCYCGGDLCVCSYGGEIPCFGCEDCESDDDYDDVEEGV